MTIEGNDNIEFESFFNGKLPIGLTKEQILSKNLKKIVKKLLKLENYKNSFAKVLLTNIDKCNFSELMNYPEYLIKENIIKKNVKSSNIGGLNFVCVDGSSVLKNFMNIDFSFLKAIVVKYHFNNNYDAHIQFYPDLNGFNNYAVEGNYINSEERVVETKVSLDLRHMELNLLNELLETTSDIDMIIIDGSILITPLNLTFSIDYELSMKYDNLLKEYQELYMNCKEKRVLLIGVIKDTKTAALTNLLRESIQLLKPGPTNLQDFIAMNYRQIMDYFCDIDLFNRLLQKSERSCVFKIKREIEKIRQNEIKKEIPYYFPLDFYAFYCKTAQYDTPIRIEFFTEKNSSINEVISKAKLIASLVFPISSCNERYGLPIPQIEAHKRAVFKPNELNFLFNNLVRSLNKHGLRLIEKRRNRRPF